MPQRSAKHADSTLSERQGVIPEPHPGVGVGDLGNPENVVHPIWHVSASFLHGSECGCDATAPPPIICRSQKPVLGCRQRECHREMEVSTAQRTRQGVVPKNGAWASKDRPARRPRLEGSHVWCHHRDPTSTMTGSRKTATRKGARHCLHPQTGARSTWPLGI